MTVARRRLLTQGALGLGFGGAFSAASTHGGSLVEFASQPLSDHERIFAETNHLAVMGQELLRTLDEHPPKFARQLATVDRVCAARRMNRAVAIVLERLKKENRYRGLRRSRVGWEP